MKKFLSGIVLVVIFFAIAIRYEKYENRRVDEMFDQLNKEYPAISIDERVNSTILTIYHPDNQGVRNNPYHAYLILAGKGKRRVITGNDLNHDLTFDEAIEIGARLMKDPGTNKLKVITLMAKDTVTYQFEMKADDFSPLK